MYDTISLGSPPLQGWRSQCVYSKHSSFRYTSSSAISHRHTQQWCINLSSYSPPYLPAILTSIVNDAAGAIFILLLLEHAENWRQQDLLDWRIQFGANQHPREVCVGSTEGAFWDNYGWYGTSEHRRQQERSFICKSLVSISDSKLDWSLSARCSQNHDDWVHPHTRFFNFIYKAPHPSNFPAYAIMM